MQAFWTDAQPARLPDVFAAINARILWLCQGNYLLGTQFTGLSPAYRSIVERRYGYRIYYRIEGDPPNTIAIIAIRHGRQRPVAGEALRRTAEA
jgi:plasmid stabilization system protein ParE